MIHELKIVDPTKTPLKWLVDVPALKVPRTFAFKPGLNILWGQNGSGKTTVIRLIGTLLQCMQSGAPVVTQTSLDDLFANNDGRSYDDDQKGKDVEHRLLKAVELRHDGQGVRHFDPNHAVGMIGGAFDEDFFGEGVDNTLYRGSAGQTTLKRFSKVLASLEEGRAPKVVHKVNRDFVNSLWQTRIDIGDKILKGNVEEQGPMTVLLDEPERSYDIPTTYAIWRFIRAFAPTVQFIVASHCLFALNLPEANYIEMDKGYMEQSRVALARLPKWPEEKPPVPPKRKAKTPSKV